VDFGVHRWLRASREEAYSDWLEWIVRQLETGPDVFSFFGLTVPSRSAEWMAPERGSSPLSKRRIKGTLPT
jgi:hypothetical protein